MAWPPPQNLRALDDLTRSRLRLPCDRYAFVAIFEVLARQDQRLANRVAPELAEAEERHRHSVYSSVRHRTEALRSRLRRFGGWIGGEERQAATTNGTPSKLRGVASRR